MMAATNVYISRKTFQTIKSGRWSGNGVKGYVIGDIDVNPVENFSISCVWQSRIIDNNDLNKDFDSCLSHFPGGKNILGYVFLPSERSLKSLLDNDQAGIDREFEEAFGSYNVWLEPLGLTQAVILCLWRKSASDSDWQILFFTMNDESVTKVNCSFCEDFKPVIRIRVRANVNITISTESNSADELKAALDHQIMKLQNGNFVFGLFENSVLIERSGSLVSSTRLGWTTCRDIAKQFNEKEGRTSGSKKKAGPQQQLIIPVSMLHLITNEPQTTLQYAPIIQHHIGTFQTTRLSLPFDVLADVSEGCTIVELFNILSKAVGRQITAFFECLSLYTQENKLHTPEVFHFRPQCLDTPVTIVCPKGTTEKELEKDHLCLPLNQPFLRRGSAGLFLRLTAPGGYLLNTHIGLNDPAVKSATIALVDGYYSYHHKKFVGSRQWHPSIQDHLKLAMSWIIYLV